MTEVQNYLRNGGTLEELKAKYSISNRRHGKYPNLVLLKYDQITSPFAEQIVRECRGIILDENDSWSVVSRSFDKFFNYGEGHAAEIDWTTAKVQEKLDGSLCVLYYYDGNWNIQTSGSPDASGDVHGTGKTFHDYFWRTFDTQNYVKFGGCMWPKFHLPDVSLKDLCFIFELTGPDNRIVVVHDKARLTLLAVRNRVTGEFCDNAAYECLFPRLVREYELNSFQAISESFSSMSPLTQEGYVVVDGKGNRVKVKHPGYVALHHAKDGMTARAFLEIARNGETCEVISAFPEFRPLLVNTLAKYEELIAEIERSYEPIKHIESQKDFATLAILKRYSSALFHMRKGGSLREFMKNIHINRLEDWLSV